MRKYAAALRRYGRKVASAALSQAIDELLAVGPPEELSRDQCFVYEEELRGQRRRMVGQHSRRATLPSDQREPVSPHWRGRLDPEDTLALANGGWASHVQVWKG